MGWGVETDVLPDESAGDGTSGLGRVLRRAREQQGLSLQDAEQETHIRARYLAALEDERFELIPGSAYAKSFLREYADALGLDGRLLAEEYAGRFSAPEPVAAPLPPAQRRRYWRARLVVLAVVVLGAVTALAIWGGGGGGGGSKPRTSHVPAQLVAAVSPEMVDRPAPEPSRPHLVFLAARGDCWLSVHAGSERGPVLYEGLLTHGSSKLIVHRFLWIRIGAPWNLDVRMNGHVLAVPSSSGPAGPVNVRFALRGLSLAYY